MIHWDEIKEKWELHRNTVVLGVCFVLVFIVGFGSGRFAGKKQETKSSDMTNYTTNTNKTKVDETDTKEAGVAAAVLGEATTTPAPSVNTNCVIKGNISSTGRKLYHVKGGAFYERVKPEQCFNTKTEAQAAGFTASAR